MNIEQFRKSPLKNAWLKQDGLDLYIRKPIRPEVTLEIASIRAKHPGKGTLTKFLDKYEPNESIYFECVNNELLYRYLLRRGYRNPSPKDKLSTDLFRKKV